MTRYESQTIIKGRPDEPIIAALRAVARVQSERGWFVREEMIRTPGMGAKSFEVLLAVGAIVRSTTARNGYTITGGKGRAILARGRNAGDGP